MTLGDSVCLARPAYHWGMTLKKALAELKKLDEGGAGVEEGS